MTEIYDGVTVLTFVEWSNKPEVIQYLGELFEDCSICDGSGEHECECGHVHICEQCKGQGTSTDYRAIYETELRDEIKRLKLWMARMQPSTIITGEVSGVMVGQSTQEVKS